MEELRRAEPSWRERYQPSVCVLDHPRSRWRARIGDHSSTDRFRLTASAIQRRNRRAWRGCLPCALRRTASGSSQRRPMDGENAVRHTDGISGDDATNLLRNERRSGGSGRFAIPSLGQERYMAYDAIINGARGLLFYGGHNPHCYRAQDRALGWNWTFWSQVLKPLLSEIGTSWASVSSAARGWDRPWHDDIRPDDANPEPGRRQPDLGDRGSLGRGHASGI